jgi:hypothetical protein
MLKKVLRGIASWCRLYLATKLSHVGVDVNGLACSVHCPLACSRQTRGQGFLPGGILSGHCIGWWCLSGGCEANRLGYSMEC